MKQPIACALALAIATALGGCASTAPAFSTATETTMPATAYSGVFAQPSPLELHYPQFDKIHDDDFAPAFDAGMAQQLKEMDAIANDPAAPTFRSMVAACRSGWRSA